MSIDNKDFYDFMFEVEFPQKYNNNENIFFIFLYPKTCNVSNVFILGIYLVIKNSTNKNIRT